MPGDNPRRFRGLLGATRLAATASPLAVIATIGLGVVSGVAGAPAAWLTQELIDTLSRAGSSTIAVAALAGGAAILAGLGSCAAYLAGIPGVHLAAKVQIETESRLAAACARFVGTHILDDPEKQNQLHLAQRGAHDAPMLVTSSAMEWFSSVSSILAYVVVLYAVWPAMLVAVLMTAIPIAVIQRRVSRRAVAVAEAATSSYRWRDYYSALFTNPVSARDMRLYGAEQLFVDRLRGHLSAALGAEARQQVRTAYSQLAFTLANAAIAGGGAAVVSIATAHGKITVGDFVLFTTAVAAVQSRIASVLNLVARLSVGLGIFAHYLELVAQPAERPRGTTASGPLRRGIEFRDVWFRYRDGGNWVLRGMNLHLAAGHTHALVGFNGAGKSTIIKLLLRFYEPVHGTILWDGTDIATFDPVTLRRRIAGVLQDAVPYELSVLENITLGDMNHFGDVTRAHEAATRANLLEVIDNLPAGFTTMLSTRRTSDDGDSGVTLSGGQWQRIAVARAMMRTDADLLILDEPNTGLDPAAEHRLHTDLLRLGTRSTRLLISHRLGGLRDADRIVVLNHGTVHEAGTHQELMANRSIYHRLFSMQARGYRNETEVVA
jgi:ATP-binding cassette, subfamily B, bacterial